MCTTQDDNFCKTRKKCQNQNLRYCNGNVDDAWLGVGDHTLIVESHSVEDSAQMSRIALVGSLSADIGIGKTAIGRDGRRVDGIRASRAPSNCGSSHMLDSGDYNIMLEKRHM
jgi:hypothetical protein